MITKKLPFNLGSVIIAAAVAVGVFNLTRLLWHIAGPGFPWPRLIRLVKAIVEVAKRVTRSAVRFAWHAGAETASILAETAAVVLLAAAIVSPYGAEDWNVAWDSLIELHNNLTATFDRYLLENRLLPLGSLIQVCSNTKMGNPTTLDITTFVLGMYTTFVVYVVLSYLERHFRASVVLFLVANYVGAAAAVAAAPSGFDRAVFIHVMRQYV
eukprot:g15894.t1